MVRNPDFAFLCINYWDPQPQKIDPAERVARVLATNASWVHLCSSPKSCAPERQTKTINFAEIGIPNNYRFSCCTIDLPNFVYWVGFVTGVPFILHLWNVKFIVCCDLLGGSSAFKSGLLFLFSAEPLYQILFSLGPSLQRELLEYWQQCRAGSVQPRRDTLDKWQYSKNIYRNCTKDGQTSIQNVTNN